MSPAQAQTASPNFASILDRPASEIERPKPLPVGTYVCQVKGLPVYDKSSQKKTDFCQPTLQPLQAMDDVDQEALNDWMLRKDGSTKTLQDASIKPKYYLTEDAAWRLTKFLADCGLDVEDDNKSTRQLVEETPGKQVLVTIKHTASQDGQSVFAEVADTAAVE